MVTGTIAYSQRAPPRCGFFMPSFSRARPVTGAALLLKFCTRGAGRKRRVTTWTSALAVLGAWLFGVIPVVQVARAFGSRSWGTRGLQPCWRAVALPRLELRRSRRMNLSRKGRIMTDRSDSESPVPAELKPEVRTPQDRSADGASQDDASRDPRVSSGAEALADNSRSGADVREAVNVAEAGTRAEGDHAHPERAKSGEAPVEQVYNDPAMTEGQRVVQGDATTTGAPPGPSPAEAGSGGAQSVVGARESDRRAAGEPPAAGPPFETSADDDQNKTGLAGQYPKEEDHGTG